jgi:hypothetical protein
LRRDVRGWVFCLRAWANETRLDRPDVGGGRVSSAYSVEAGCLTGGLSSIGLRDLQIRNGLPMMTPTDEVISGGNLCCVRFHFWIQSNGGTADRSITAGAVDDVIASERSDNLS